MKVTNRQKILIGVLCAGAVFLAVDYFHAAPVVVEAEPTALVTSAAATPSLTPERRSLSVAARLDQLRRPSGPITDVFATMPLLDATTPMASTSDDPSRHRLNAVFLAGDKSQAMIDGSLVRIGQSVDGFTLVSVSRNSVILRNGERQVNLSLWSGKLE